MQLGEDSVERHANERCIDVEAKAKAEQAVRKYQSVGDIESGDDQDMDDDELAKAFEDVKLKLNINK